MKLVKEKVMKRILPIILFIVYLVFPNYGLAGTTQILGGNAGQNTFSTSAGTAYLHPVSSLDRNTTEVNRSFVVPCNGVISQLKFYATVAPDTSNSWKLTLKTGARGSVGDSALTCTIADTATSASDLDAGHSVSVTKGQLFVFSIVTTKGGGTIPSSYGGFSYIFVPTTANQTIMCGGTAGGSLSAVDTTVEYLSVAGGGAVPAAVGNAQLIMPCAGNITGLTGFINTTPGAGKTRDFTVNVAGSDSALTVNVANTEYIKSATGSIAVNAGDLVCVSTKNNGGAAASIAGASIIFEPTTAGQFVIASNSNGAALPTASNTYYQTVHNGSSSSPWGLVANRVNLPTSAGFTVNSIYTNISAPPNGAGKKWTFKLLDDGTLVTGATTVYEDAETGIKWVTGLSVAVADGSFIVTSCLPASTPGAASAMISYAGYIAPTTTTRTDRMFQLF